MANPFSKDKSEAAVSPEASNVAAEPQAPSAPAEEDVSPLPVSPPSTVHTAWVVVEDLKKALADAKVKLDAEVSIWKAAVGDEGDILVASWKETKALLAKALADSEAAAKDDGSGGSNPA